MERMLARGRADDTAEAISRRLALYHSETTPLLEHYANVLVAIDGVGPVEEVQQRALAALNSKLGSPRDRERLRLRSAQLDGGTGYPAQDPGRAAGDARVRAGPGRSDRRRAGRVAPGASTLDIEHAVAAVIADAGATSNFLHYGAHGADPGFPATICASVNDEVVHGIPSAGRILREGDLLSPSTPAASWTAGIPIRRSRCTSVNHPSRAGDGRGRPDRGLRAGDVGRHLRGPRRRSARGHLRRRSSIRRARPAAMTAGGTGRLPGTAVTASARPCTWRRSWRTRASGARGRGWSPAPPWPSSR